MATYDELRLAAENGPLKNRIGVACAIQALVILAESNATANHDKRLLWAKEVFTRGPDNMGARMMPAVLARTQITTPTVTLAQLTGASDASILSAVASTVDAVAVSGSLDAVVSP